jgi:hypothetical protein
LHVAVQSVNRPITVILKIQNTPKYIVWFHIKNFGDVLQQLMADTAFQFILPAVASRPNLGHVLPTLAV